MGLSHLAGQSRPLDQTVQYFLDQDVHIKVISGDNPATVGAIATQAGVPGASDPVDARTLPEDPAELAEPIDTHSVFGRVTPAQKQSMVEALHLRKRTVAMTGDGVNDVLALKQADLGIAMGSGSSATRAVAQLVLLDNKFSVMPNVVAEGRRVINNIERVASLFLAKTVYSLILSLLTGVFALAYPLQPIHLTILSWLTIGTPAFFMALEPNDQRVEEGFLQRVLGHAIPAGMVIAAQTMIVFSIVQIDAGISEDEAKSIAVLVAGSVALMNLYRTAMPLNTLRRALVVVMTALFAGAFLLPRTRDVFDLPVVNEVWAYGLAAVFIVLAYPLLVFGSRVSQRVHDRRLASHA